jgi:UDP-3-O-[3-hydroxymyristoyl] glucosamine N-acyltransferase
MSLTLSELAARLGAQVEGDGTVEITGINGIETAGPGDVSFLANQKYIPHLATTQATAIIVPPPSQSVRYDPKTVRSGAALLIHENPYFAFLQALTLFHPPPSPPAPGIDPSAKIGHRVKLSDGVYVGPNCVVEDEVSLGEGTVILANSYVGAHSVLGEECTIGPTVTILHQVTIGNRVRIHPGSVIGADGFGYAPAHGKHHKIPQVGGVTIHDDVEIGACCTVDRATMGQTVIGRGTKIDNLVQIAHNVQVGEDCIFVSQVGISGSTNIGNKVTLAGQVGVIGHIEIGDGATVAAQSGVAKSIPPGATQFGSPAVDFIRQKRIIATMLALPDHVKTIRKLEKRVTELENALKHGKTT